MDDDYVGWAWHVHHDVLLEWCYSLEERQAIIMASKPRAEVGLRLRLLTPVLHPERIPQSLQKARIWSEYIHMAHAAEIEILHQEEHPDCPWNGQTIFSKV